MHFRGSLFSWTSSLRVVSWHFCRRPWPLQGRILEVRSLPWPPRCSELQSYMMFVKGMSEASKMGGYKFSGCAVEKKTHSYLGNVTALNLRNYLVSLSWVPPAMVHCRWTLQLCDAFVPLGCWLHSWHLQSWILLLGCSIKWHLFLYRGEKSESKCWILGLSSRFLLLLKAV